MAMNLGGGHGPQATINVTPMIDVLLVLLIIFMAITPSRTVGLPAHAPQPAPATQAPQPQPNMVVAVVRHGGIVEINHQSVPIGELARRLTAIFGGVRLATLFVDADRDLEFAHVARVIDIARGAGVSQIGLMPGANRP